MIINVEEVEELRARMAEINDVPLDEIEWHKDGKKLDINKKDIEFWKYVGLSNLYFLEHIECTAKQ